MFFSVAVTRVGCLLGLAIMCTPAVLPLGAQAREIHTGLRPTVVMPDSGEQRILNDGRKMLLKVGPANGGASYFFLGSEAIPPGTAVPRHRHEVDEELLIVIRGRLQVSVNDSTVEAPAGSVVYLPPRTWVALKNAAVDTASVMFVFPRGAVERCFQFIGRSRGEATRRPLTAQERAEAPRACQMTYEEH